MMTTVLQDLERIRQENLKLLAAGDDDTARVLRWGERRESIFVRLREGDLKLDGEELATATSLIKEIVGLDAMILARLQELLVTLNQKSTAAARIRRALAGSSYTVPSAVMRRVA